MSNPFSFLLPVPNNDNNNVINNNNNVDILDEIPLWGVNNASSNGWGDFINWEGFNAQQQAPPAA